MAVSVDLTALAKTDTQMVGRCEAAFTRAKLGSTPKPRVKRAMSTLFRGLYPTAMTGGCSQVKSTRIRERKLTEGSASDLVTVAVPTSQCEFEVSHST